MEKPKLRHGYLRGKTWWSNLRYPNHPKSDKQGKLRIPLSTNKRTAELKIADLLQQRDRQGGEAPLADDSWEGFKARFYELKKSPITIRHYKRAVGLLEGHRRMKSPRDITVPLLQELQAKWKERGLYVRNRDIGNLAAMAKKAEAWRINIPQDWELIELEPEPRGRIDFFTIKEVRHLIKHTFNNWRTMTYLGARAGLRPGEMLFLEWTDIEFKADKIHIDSKPQHGWHIKTYERRTIPMPKDLKAHLKSVFTGRKSQWVVANEEGDRPASVGVMSTYFSRRVRAAGLKGHLYKLRHTYGSHLAQAGVPLQVIRDLMGHKSVTTTEIYTHLIPRMHQAAVNKLPT